LRFVIAWLLAAALFAGASGALAAILPGAPWVWLESPLSAAGERLRENAAPPPSAPERQPESSRAPPCSSHA